MASRFPELELSGPSTYPNAPIADYHELPDDLDADRAEWWKSRGDPRGLVLLPAPDARHALDSVCSDTLRTADEPGLRAWLAFVARTRMALPDRVGPKVPRSAIDDMLAEIGSFCGRAAPSGSAERLADGLPVIAGGRRFGPIVVEAVGPGIPQRLKQRLAPRDDDLASLTVLLAAAGKPGEAWTDAALAILDRRFRAACVTGERFEPNVQSIRVRRNEDGLAVVARPWRRPGWRHAERLVATCLSNMEAVWPDWGHDADLLEESWHPERITCVRGDELTFVVIAPDAPDGGPERRFWWGVTGDAVAPVAMPLPWDAIAPARA